jgi:hypothetical protein
MACTLFRADGAPSTKPPPYFSDTAAAENEVYSGFRPNFFREKGRENTAGGLCPVARSYDFWYSAFASVSRPIFS